MPCLRHRDYSLPCFACDSLTSLAVDELDLHVCRPCSSEYSFLTCQKCKSAFVGFAGQVSKWSLCPDCDGRPRTYPSPVRDMLRAALVARPEYGYTPAAIQKRTGMNYSYVLRVLQKLMEEGVVFRHDNFYSASRARPTRLVATQGPTPPPNQYPKPWNKAEDVPPFRRVPEGVTCCNCERREAIAYAKWSRPMDYPVCGICLSTSAVTRCKICDKVVSIPKIPDTAELSRNATCEECLNRATRDQMCLFPGCTARPGGENGYCTMHTKELRRKAVEPFRGPANLTP